MKFTVGPSALLVCTVCWSAELTTNVPPSDASSQSESTPARPRNLSPALAAKLTEALPKFTPKSEAPDDASTSAGATPARDIPRNGILRLPNYEVRERRIPEFKERDMLTPKGKVELALKRHPGLRFGPFAFLNIAWGLAMLEEEHKLERRLEMEYFEDSIKEFDYLLAAEKAAKPAQAADK
jgi:hypothetical protein